MKEIFIYLIASVGFLFLLGYSIHMILNGIVSNDTQWTVIVIAESAGFVALAIMARNIIRARRHR